jgi:hydroxypyruvate isomerase
MRYAGHLGLRAPDCPLFRHGARSGAPADQIRFLADIGFAGVQDNFLEVRTAAEQERIGGELERAGLAMGSFTGNPRHWNQPLWSARDVESCAALRRGLDASIETACRVNGHLIGCVTGIRDDVPRERQIEAMIDNLRFMAERAARARVALCVEPVAAQWIPGLLVQDIATALRIVEAVGAPSVRIMFDIGHVQMSDGEVLQHLERCWNHIGAIQAADCPGRIDLGAGELDWPAILGTIRRKGFDGLIEIEHLPLEDSAAGERRLIERLHAVDAALD